MEILPAPADGYELFPEVEIITKIKQVRYNKIQIPSSNTIILTGRNRQALERLLKEKSIWICRKLAELKEMEAFARIGEGVFYYFGRPHSVEEIPAVKKECRAALLSYASACLGRSAERPPKLSIRRMRSRLGTYSTKKDEIRLSAYLVFLPNELIDYIIFHELTHRDVRGHGSDFWRRIESRYPDWKNKEKEIDFWWMRVKKQIAKHELLKSV